MGELRWSWRGGRRFWLQLAAPSPYRLLNTDLGNVKLLGYDFVVLRDNRTAMTRQNGRVLGTRGVLER